MYISLFILSVNVEKFLLHKAGKLLARLLGLKEKTKKNHVRFFHVKWARFIRKVLERFRK